MRTACGTLHKESLNMPINEGLIAEMDQEAEATRRMLERVPGDRLDWKPHQKSMSLGQLALHVAGTPGSVAGLLLEDTIPPLEFEESPTPSSKEEVLEALDESLGRARDILSGLDDEAMMGMFRIMDGDREVIAMPKAGLARAILLNHWYHHRGQLSVYLRLLDVPVPATYGASADENLLQ
jgi:uncharacterized damage-inducible protein DinB